MTLNRLVDVGIGVATIGITARMMNYAVDVIPKQRKKGKKKRRGY